VWSITACKAGADNEVREAIIINVARLADRTTSSAASCFLGKVKAVAAVKRGQIQALLETAFSSEHNMGRANRDTTDIRIAELKSSDRKIGITIMVKIVHPADGHHGTGTITEAQASDCNAVRSIERFQV
jgi:hypothetical protein